MPVLSVVELLLQLLPLVAADTAALATILNTAGEVVTRAKANGDKVSDADWKMLAKLRLDAEDAFNEAAT